MKFVTFPTEVRRRWWFSVGEELGFIFWSWLCTVPTVMENLEKSWNVNMVISWPGKVLGKNEITKVLEKSWKCVIVTHVHLR